MVSMVYELAAIDVHGHFGRYLQLETHPLKQRFMSGDLAAAVPEPSSLVLTGIALASGCGVAWKRRRKYVTGECTKKIALGRKST